MRVWKVAFMAGMRRSEVAALRWADVDDAAASDGVLVTVRRGKRGGRRGPECRPRRDQAPAGTSQRAKRGRVGRMSSP